MKLSNKEMNTYSVRMMRIFLSLLLLGFAGSVKVCAQDSINVLIRCYSLDTSILFRNKSFYPPEKSRGETHHHRPYSYIAVSYPNNTDTLVPLVRGSFGDILAPAIYPGLIATGSETHLRKLYLPLTKGGDILLPLPMSEEVQNSAQNLTLTYGYLCLETVGLRLAPHLLFYPEWNSYIFTSPSRTYPTRIHITTDTYSAFYIVSNYKIIDKEGKIYIDTRSDSLPLLSFLDKRYFSRRQLRHDSIRLFVYYENLDYDASPEEIRLKDKKGELDQLAERIEKELSVFSRVIGHPLPRVDANVVFSYQKTALIADQDTNAFSFSFVSSSINGGLDCLMFDSESAQGHTLVHELLHLLVKTPSLGEHSYEQSFIRESLIEYVACVITDNATHSMRENRKVLKRFKYELPQVRNLLSTGDVYYSRDKETPSTGWVYYSYLPIRLSEYARSQKKTQLELAKAILHTLEEMCQIPNANMDTFRELMRSKGFLNIEKVYQDI